MAEYVEMYRQRTGLDPRPYLATYLAYNFFRIAAILNLIVGLAAITLSRNIGPSTVSIEDGGVKDEPFLTSRGVVLRIRAWLPS